MKKLGISVIFSFRLPLLDSEEHLEERYQNSWRFIATFLYKHPNNKAAISIPGTILLWLEKKHPEFIKVLEKLVSRSQIEILGGAFYNPILPAIFPVDRSGQIELLTTEIRRLFGKRPRGAFLFASAFENSLVPTLQNCGFEYALLDGSLLSGKSTFVPYIATERGKSIRLVFSDEIKPNAMEDPVDFLEKLLFRADGSFCSIVLKDDDFALLLNSLWIEKFFFIIRNEFRDRAWISLQRESLYSTDEEFRPIYLASAISSEFDSATFFDFLLKNPESKSLYNRMLHVSMLLSQSRGDKARRENAREFLWAAQAGEAYLFDDDGRMRQKAWKLLSEAENELRETADFSPMTSSYDYDGDGRNEYVCSMERFTACISPVGARIFEFCPIKNPAGNYADTTQSRGLFVSRFLSESEYGNFKTGGDVSGVFSGRFSEQFFSASKNEIRLFSSCDLSAEKKISLSKKFVAKGNGFTVQVILKNECALDVAGVLTVECDFARMDFSDDGGYGIEVVYGSEYLQGERDSFGGENARAVELLDVSLMQLTDSFSDISFVFEPNEKCSVVLLQNKNGGLSASLCWHVKIGAGGELEKTVNFAVVALKKKHGK